MKHQVTVVEDSTGRVVKDFLIDGTRKASKVYNALMHRTDLVNYTLNIYPELPEETPE